MKTKTRFKVLLFILLLINASMAYSQGSPCQNGFIDGDTPCPLDTWVIILVVAASLFAALRLSRRSKLTA